LTLGKDGAAIHRDSQLSEAAPADLRRHVERRLELVTEAHGLTSQVNSDGAALDLDLHFPSFKHSSSTKARLA